ncbi:hypothetical protein [Edaphocola flava]|uniref:hypothetical protein n=1 Tax=Edaphocola flava TaxID=2499629 RepID=UPI00100C098F|nr:hypothetical protein [Edaphocola flava]
MKKITYLIAMGALLPIAANAQQNEIPAPKRADYVVEINLPYIFSQTDIHHIDQSESARSLYESLFDLNHNYESDKDITQSGIDHQRKAYMHFVMTDSVNYEVRLLPIANVDLFKKVMDVNERKQSKEINGGRIFFIKDSDKRLFIANSGAYGILIDGSERYRAFEDSVRAARYSIKPVEYSDYYLNEDEDVTEATAVEVAPPPPPPPPIVPKSKKKQVAKTETTKIVEIAPPPPPPPPKVAIVTYEGNKEEEAAEVVEAAAAEVYEIASAVAVDTTAPYIIDAPVVIERSVEYNSNFDQERYNADRELYERKVDSVMNIWQEQFLENMVVSNTGTYQQLSYFKDLERPKSNSAFTVYMNASASPVTSWMGYFYGVNSWLREQPQEQKTSEDNWVMLQLNFESNAVKVNALTHTDERNGKRISRIYKRKLNPKFARYINSSSDIGVVAMAFNTQNYLEEMPGILKDAFNQLHTYGSQEATLLADVFSLVVDEKAIGKAISGDAAFVFTNIKQKSYKTIEYIWDEETYASTEKEVERQENLPNFLLMFTTKDDHIFHKLLDYATEKNLMVLENGIYKISEKKSYDPFDYYCLIKDGIVFIGTDAAEMQAIKDGAQRGGLTKADKRLLMKHNGSGWFYANKLVDKIMNEEDGSMRKLRMNKLLNNVGQMQFATEKNKKGRVEANYILNIPNQRTNALEYLIYLLDDMRKAW